MTTFTRRTALGLGEQPAPVRRLTATGGIGRIEVGFEHPHPYDPQIDHYAVHASRTPGFAPNAENLLAKTVYTRFRHDKLGGRAQAWHYRVVVVAASGKRSAPSAEVAGSSVDSVAFSGEPVATVGSFDHRSLEFALAPNGSAQYPTRFPNGVDFTAGPDDPKTDWSYIHPGPADSWAGRKEHRASFRFPLSTVPAGELWLAMWLIDTHATIPGRARLALNGTAVRDIAFEPGATRGSLEGDANLPGSPLRPSYVELALPTQALVSGENALTLDKYDGSWHVYDAFGVFLRR